MKAKFKKLFEKIGIGFVILVGIVFALHASYRWSVVVHNVVWGVRLATSQPVVDVELKDMNTGKISYECVHDNRTSIALESAVDMDDVTVYYGGLNIFNCDIIDGEIVNTVIDTSVLDDNENIIKDDPKVTEVLTALAENVPHEFFEIRMFPEKEKMYIAAQMNVNWHSPCDFYEYDFETKKLKFLYQWEDTDVVGIRTY